MFTLLMLYLTNRNQPIIAPALIAANDADAVVVAFAA
jgi:hypothetical protein